MKSEPKNLSVLQNLEFSIVSLWREHHEMSDYAALRAYEAAFALYRAEWRGHEPKPPELTGLDAAAFEAVREMCEFRLGRKPDPEDADNPIEPISLETLLDCLRQLQKSVKRHTEHGGRQGYLTFIDRFLK